MISAGPLQGEWVDFQPFWKILPITNSCPKTRGSDDGIPQSIGETPFELQFAADEQ